METLIERVAGLDVDRDTVVACVRVPGPVAGPRATGTSSRPPPRACWRWATGWWPTG